MAKELQNNKQYILESLQNNLDEALSHVDSLKQSIKDEQYKLSQNKSTSKHEREKSLEELDEQVNENVTKIKHLFGDSQLKVQVSDDESLHLSIAMEFSNEKKKMMTNIDILMKRLKELKYKFEEAGPSSDLGESSLLDKFLNKIEAKYQTSKKETQILSDRIEDILNNNEDEEIKKKGNETVCKIRTILSKQEKYYEETKIDILTNIQNGAVAVKRLKDKIEKTEQKITCYVDEFDMVIHKKESIDNFINAMYAKFEIQTIAAQHLKQMIENKLNKKFNESVFDRAGMETDLNKISEELNEKIEAFSTEFQNSKNELSLKMDFEMCNVAMNFQTKCETLKLEISQITKQFNDIMEKYNITKESTLAQKTVTESRIELKTTNGLKIFKFPVKSVHAVPNSKLRNFENGQQCSGERDHRYILLVGMTGSGKSLLINNFVNYIYGVKHSDKFRFRLIVDEEEVNEREAGSGTSTAESMTSWVTSYTLHWQEGFGIPYTLTIIDTPGFADTRGLEYDDKIMGQIRMFFDDKKFSPTQELSSIGFLIQSSQARLTIEQKYIFNKVLSLFGKDVERNIFWIFTFADLQKPPALEAIQSDEQIQVSEKHTFKFNNSALYSENNNPISVHSWNFGYTQIKKYFEILQQTIPISLKLTITVLSERETLRLTLGALQTEIYNGMEILRNIEEQSQIIVNLDGTIASKKDYKVKKQTVLVTCDVVDCSITNCNVCNFTCHNPCRIVGNNKAKCLAMKDEICFVCPKKCPAKVHSNGNSIFIYKNVEVEETIEEMMKEYKIAVGESNDKKKLMIEMLNKYKQKKEQIFERCQEASRSHNLLEKISLRFGNLNNVDYIERLIQYEENNSRPYKTERIKQLQHLKQMAETLLLIKDEPHHIPQCVSDYESKIETIISLIKDEDDCSASPKIVGASNCLSVKEKFRKAIQKWKKKKEYRKFVNKTKKNL